MTSIYKRIAKCIHEMIPCEWEKTWLYAEILDDSASVIFYFLQPEDDELVYAHHIPTQFGLSKDIYIELLLNLQEELEKLKEEFKQNNVEIWTTISLQLERSGAFSITYGYEDVFSIGLNGYQRKTVWKYKTFGILPDDEEDKKAVLNYIKNEEGNN